MEGVGSTRGEGDVKCGFGVGSDWGGIEVEVGYGVDFLGLAGLDIDLW